MAFAGGMSNTRKAISQDVGTDIWKHLFKKSSWSRVQERRKWSLLARRACSRWKY